MRPARATSRAPALLLAVACLALPGVARAQATPPVAPAPRRPIVIVPGVDASRPLLVTIPDDAAEVRSQYPIEPLAPAQAARLRRASDLRFAGLADRARDSLTVLLREVPHHPVLVTELVRTHVARGDFAAAERLARAERAARRDSALAGRELAAASERLGRPRDAILATVETWIVSPIDAEWAAQNVLRLATAEPKAAREAMRTAAARTAGRADVARGEALLLARLGRPDEAARAILAAEVAGRRPPLRFSFAHDLLASGIPADSTAAVAALLSLAADGRAEGSYRVASARRAWDVEAARGGEAAAAPRIRRALADVEPARWGGDLLLGVARGLRQAGQTAEARALLHGEGVLAQQMPELALEQILADLRDGPPERGLPALDSLAKTWPEARWHLAEAQFWSGALDSAHANYGRVANVTDGPWAGAALERTYLLEEAPGSPALRMLGRIAFEDWRGDRGRARALADSLYASLQPRQPLYAHAALLVAEQRVAAGDARAALAPLLVVADSLAGDRLAPLARQRAGDAYLLLRDEAAALAQYEECLARYPRAWNAPEVRRRVEQLRRDRRF